MELPAGWPESYEGRCPPRTRGFKARTGLASVLFRVSRHAGGARPVARSGASPGVGSFFRVYTGDGSGLLVCRSGFDLGGSRPWPLPSSRRPLGPREKRAPGDSPLELNLSLRVRSAHGLCPFWSSKATSSSQAPLLRFRPLQRSKIQTSTNRGFASPASFHLRRFSRPWRFAPSESVPSVSPGHVHGVPCPAGVFPQPPEQRPLDLCFPSWRFCWTFPLSTGGLRRGSSPHLQGFALWLRPSSLT